MTSRADRTPTQQGSTPHGFLDDRMSMDPTGDQLPGHDLQSQLSELLACEQELERLLSAAQDEARQRVEDARAAASQAANEMEVASAEEARHVRSTIEDRAEERVRAILDESRERAARYEGASGEEVEALGDSAFRRLIGADGRS